LPSDTNVWARELARFSDWLNTASRARRVATDQELFDIVVRFFVESRDFNGIPASGLARAAKTEWPDVLRLARVPRTG
jgi:hypothetical protein